MKAYLHIFLQLALGAGKMYQVSVALLTGKGFSLSGEQIAGENQPSLDVGEMRR